mmetsp:Transcript_153841/g.493357  ORF Transcript_153841/g.493357 Transcript_153841/m.493357 type:complete len:240 (-) Transcript_153841:25-744(-)
MIVFSEHEQKQALLDARRRTNTGGSREDGPATIEGPVLRRQRPLGLVAQHSARKGRHQVLVHVRPRSLRWRPLKDNTSNATMAVERQTLQAVQKLPLHFRNLRDDDHERLLREATHRPAGHSLDQHLRICIPSRNPACSLEACDDAMSGRAQAPTSAGGLQEGDAQEPHEPWALRRRPTTRETRREHVLHKVLDLLQEQGDVGAEVISHGLSFGDHPLRMVRRPRGLCECDGAWLDDVR